MYEIIEEIRLVSKQFEQLSKLSFPGGVGWSSEENILQKPHPERAEWSQARKNVVCLSLLAEMYFAFLRQLAEMNFAYLSSLAEMNLECITGCEIKESSDKKVGHPLVFWH